MNCQDAQEFLDRLAQSAGLQHEFDSQLSQHLEGCDECAAQRALLLALTAEELQGDPPPLSPQLLARVEAGAREALRATGRRQAPSRQAVSGWSEIAAPLAVSSLALPIALGQGWLWLQGLGLLLESWLPQSIVTGIAVVHVVSVALTLGALYAAIPLAVAYASSRTQLEAS